MSINHILVVDDEPGVIQLCRRLLEKSGFEVVTHTDPNKGLESLKQQKAEMLLVDIRMPGMDGFEMMEAARLIQPDLAVVIMTGFGTLETAIQALQRGADGLILKPFTGKELIGGVQHALEQSRAKQDMLRLHTLRPLFNLSEILFSETNPERLQELLLSAVCGHLKCALSAYFHRHETSELELKGYYLIEENILRENEQENTAGKAPAVLKEAFQPLLQRVVLENIPLIASYPALFPEKPATSFLDQIGSVICTPLPLKSEEKPTHFLLAARASGTAPFQEADLEMFVVLARQAAVAMENARLHAELRAYIRQLEESQRALIQAEKMAIAGRLTASIAHEINNPLQSVQNCLHLARRKELTPTERQNYLDLAHEELERLMETVQRMLDFYRPTALERKPTDLHALIRKVLTLMEKQLSDHSIDVKISFAPGLPLLYVVGDQIQQVFLNILLNAIEAMPSGGTIFIETAPKQDWVEIIFRDTGPGVPEEHRKSIFEPFYSTKQGGTGLGLAISYGIITAHNGILELIDHPESGACFRILLKIGET